MEIAIRGKNVELSDSLKEYIDEKVGRLQKYLDSILAIDVTLTVEKNRSIENTQRAEVTVHVNGNVIRAEESTVSMYSSIDIVVEKLERQLKRYKSKIYSSMRDRKRSSKEIGLVPEPEYGGNGEPVDHSEPYIARTKEVILRPMTPSEATLQMELLGHDFHLFLNPESGNVNLVYRRKDGNYGLLEPETTA
ncbi:MAG: ribosome-associated translation inhibitor RaiA [bacterium]|nr:ribosome-associated translation inhibitor RaiA [bacterium]